MWSNNTGDANIEGDQIEVLKMSNGHENIDPNIFFFSKLRQIKYAEGMISRQ